MTLRALIHNEDPRLQTPGDELDLPPAILHALRDALRGIRFGAVELVIHDGRIVQLERREKVRFETEVNHRKPRG